jgi:hypothetical protein
MINKEIIAKGYILNLIFMIAIFTAIPYFMYYKLSNELFLWKEFNRNGITTLAFLAFSLIGILSWIKLLDNNPFLIINKKGIWIRKSILPFSPLKYIEWNQIKFVELNTIKGNKGSKTTVLIIYRNDVSKTKTIDLDSLDYPSEDIISLVREFSNLLNYRDRITVNQ